MTRPTDRPELEAVPCPVCGSTNMRRVLQAGDDLCGVPGVYDICRCRDCGHRFLNPRPTRATLSRCYPEHYGPHQSVPVTAGREVAPGREVAARHEVAAETSSTPWYLRFLPLRRIPGLKALYYRLTDDRGQPLPAKPEDANTGDEPAAFELGCATGAYLARLAAAGWTVEGVEPAAAAAETARQSGLNVRTGVLDDISPPAASFDCAAAWMVLEHVYDPETTLRQLHQLLKPGGQLLISVPNAGCWEPLVFRSTWYVWEPPRHLHHFTPSSLRRVLYAAGFTDICIIHQRNILNIIGSLGILLTRLPGTRGLGRRLINYPNAPRMLVQLALSPFAHLLAWIHQGGRLTILARRPPESASADHNKAAQF
ncbi:MAG: class I SAM-dependent methyltransferase [Fuerstiella sp.]